MKGSNYIILTMLLGLSSLNVVAAEKAAVLQWSERVELSTPVSGVIKQVFVGVGDKVTKGQGLIKIDDRGFQSHIKQAKAILTRAKETFDEAKRELDRAAELFDRNAISVRDRQLVKIEYTKAFASLQEAQAILTQALLDMEYSTITSPISGIVVSRSVVNGQTINNSIQANVMIVVADNQKMIARALLSSEEMKGLRIGTSSDVKVQGEIISGTISSLGQESVSNDGSAKYPLEITFKNPGFLRQGQSAAIILP